MHRAAYEATGRKPSVRATYPVCDPQARQLGYRDIFTMPLPSGKEE
jgi:hypothetical protein